MVRGEPSDAAQAYKGVIPDDRFKAPYMPRAELRHEIEHGVGFWGFEQDGHLVGVMGLQDVEDVMLIRHAYAEPPIAGAASVAGC